MKALTSPKALVAVLAAFALSTLVARIALGPGLPPPPHFVTVMDVSDSAPRDCKAQVDMARAAIEVADGRYGSTFAIIATGSEGTRFEPQLVVIEAVPATENHVTLAGKSEESALDSDT